MAGRGEAYSESFPAVAESVPRARAAVTDFAERAGATEERLQAIQLAASEAVTNAIRHAYADPRQAGEVEIAACRAENELWLLVADSGTGLRASSRAPGLGLGLPLIAQLADDFEILSRGTGGTEVRLRFKLRTREREPDEPRAQLRGSFSRAISPA
jgi:serine/threonine-protein kinase RsbW